MSLTYLFQVFHGHLNLLQVLFTFGQLRVHLAPQLNQQTDNKKPNGRCHKNASVLKTVMENLSEKKRRYPEHFHHMSGH